MSNVDMRPTPADRVTAGAAWLDEHVPDWVARIDVERLDLDDCATCVLGQLFGNYFKSPIYERDVSAPLGFASWWAEVEYDYDTEKAALNDEWLRLIAARRNKETPA